MGTYASAEALSAVIAAHGAGIDGRCPTCPPDAQSDTGRYWQWATASRNADRAQPGPELIGARRIRIESQR